MQARANTTAVPKKVKARKTKMRTIQNPKLLYSTAPISKKEISLTTTIALIALGLIAVLYFLGNQSNSMDRQIQLQQNKIVQTSQTADELQAEVSRLSSKSRLDKLAEKKGFSSKDNQVKNIN